MSPTPTPAPVVAPKPPLDVEGVQFIRNHVDLNDYVGPAVTHGLCDSHETLRSQRDELAKGAKKLLSEIEQRLQAYMSNNDEKTTEDYDTLLKSLSFDAMPLTKVVKGMEPDWSPVSIRDKFKPAPGISPEEFTEKVTFALSRADWRYLYNENQDLSQNIEEQIYAALQAEGDTDPLPIPFAVNGDARAVWNEARDMSLDIKQVVRA